MKILVVMLLAVTVIACTPIYKKGEVAYDFVGCHTVGAENPKNGETAWAIWPGNKLKEGQKLYFKQVNPETLEIGKVQTATPCK
jgi:hypothetical protein|tara:strand:- start:1093 stop:1344 length:252 start_codon:yes stop_codon:yes gene_type:complete